MMIRGLSRRSAPAAAAAALLLYCVPASADGVREFGAWGAHPRAAMGDGFKADLRRFAGSEGIPRSGQATYTGPVTARVNGGGPFPGNANVAIDFGKHKAQTDLTVALLTPGSQLALSGTGPLVGSLYATRLTGDFRLLNEAASLKGGALGLLSSQATQTFGLFSASGPSNLSRQIAVQGSFSAPRH